MSKKAVVVDDDLKVTLLVEKVLTPLGFQVFRANEGQKALALVRREKPDLLIADILLPGIDGIGLCQTIKNDPELGGIKVILITEVFKGASFRTEIGCHVDGFLEKPLDSKILAEMVTKRFDDMKHK